jgi:hypothetical protein
MNASEYYGICPICRTVGREIVLCGVAWSVCDTHQLKWWTEFRGEFKTQDGELVPDLERQQEGESHFQERIAINSYREVEMTTPESEEEALNIDKECGWTVMSHGLYSEVALTGPPVDPALWEELCAGVTAAGISMNDFCAFIQSRFPRFKGLGDWEHVRPEYIRQALKRTNDLIQTIRQWVAIER